MADKNELQGVIEFVQSVREGSFTRAAEVLGLTGSAVSKSITRLEKRLATKLLHRTTRRISLTQEGARYFDACSKLLDELGHLEHDFASGRGELIGKVRMDVPGAFGRRHLMPVLNQLTSEHPRLDLSIMFSERKADIIGERIDLAVRIGQLEDNADLIAVKLGVQRPLVCASPAYLAQHGAPTTPAELLDHDCLVGWLGGRGRDNWPLKSFSGEVVGYPVRVRHELSDGEALLEATIAGDGLAQLPTWLIDEHLASGELVTVLDEFVGAEMPIHVVWSTTAFEKHTTRAVIEALKATAKEEGSGFMP